MFYENKRKVYVVGGISHLLGHIYRSLSSVHKMQQERTQLNAATERERERVKSKKKSWGFKENQTEAQLHIPTNRISTGIEKAEASNTKQAQSHTANQSDRVSERERKRAGEAIPKSKHLLLLRPHLNNLMVLSLSVPIIFFFGPFFFFNIYLFMVICGGRRLFICCCLINVEVLKKFQVNLCEACV